MAGKTTGIYRLQRECYQGAGDGGGGTHRGPGCCRCRHIPPAAPSKGEAHQTSVRGPHLLSLRARTHPTHTHPPRCAGNCRIHARVCTHKRTHTPHTSPRGAQATAGLPREPTADRPWERRPSAGSRLPPSPLQHLPEPQTLPPHTRAHTRHLSPHLGTRGVRAVFSAAPGPGGRGELWGLQGIPSSCGPPTCTSPTRPPLAGVRARGACLDPGVVRRGARLRHLQPTEPETSPRAGPQPRGRGEAHPRDPNPPTHEREAEGGVRGAHAQPGNTETVDRGHWRRS